MAPLHLRSTITCLGCWPVCSVPKSVQKMDSYPTIITSYRAHIFLPYNIKYAGGGVAPPDPHSGNDAIEGRNPMGLKSWRFLLYSDSACLGNGGGENKTEDWTRRKKESGRRNKIARERRLSCHPLLGIPSSLLPPPSLSFWCCYCWFCLHFYHPILFACSLPFVHNLWKGRLWQCPSTVCLIFMRENNQTI